MKDQIQIGARPKRLHQIEMVISSIILATCLVITLFDSNALFLLAAFSVSTLFQFNRIKSYRYLSFSNGHFILEGLFAKKKIIKADDFVRVSKSLIASFPFVNDFTIHFRNGDAYEVMGNFGTRRLKDVETMIDNIIKSSNAAAKL